MNRLIVIEGLNGVGKTTTIDKALENYDAIYNKGFTEGTVWSNYLKHHPTSLQYYMDLALKTTTIKSKLEHSEVWQDRYIQSVDSFLPDAKYKHNLFFRNIFDPLFLEPDVYIYVTAKTETIVERLKKDNRDSYRIDLTEHIEKIETRKTEYDMIFEEMNCEKYILDTTEKTPEECANELIEVLGGKKSDDKDLWNK